MSVCWTGPYLTEGLKWPVETEQPRPAQLTQHAAPSSSKSSWWAPFTLLLLVLIHNHIPIHYAGQFTLSKTVVSLSIFFCLIRNCSWHTVRLSSHYCYITHLNTPIQLQAWDIPPLTFFQRQRQRESEPTKTVSYCEVITLPRNYNYFHCLLDYMHKHSPTTSDIEWTDWLRWDGTNPALNMINRPIMLLLLLLSYCER